MANNKVIFQSVYDLVQSKKRVDPHDLRKASDAFYKEIKTVGLSKTKVIYDDANGKETVKSATEIPETMRAVACFVETLLERWEGSSLERLRNHYELSMSVRHYLPEELYENSHTTSSMKYLTIDSFIDSYLKQ
ncbi:MAG: hypothetical protein HFJ35_07320 [Clostridia bacterium]|nr:hypothetical protein [Clostridia bacterium]